MLRLDKFAVRLGEGLHRLGELVEGLAKGQPSCLLWVRLIKLLKLLWLLGLRVHDLLSLAAGQLPGCKSWQGRAVLEPQMAAEYTC